jgi:hypothetical protein
MTSLPVTGLWLTGKVTRGLAMSKRQGIQNPLVAKMARPPEGDLVLPKQIRFLVLVAAEGFEPTTKGL